MPQNSGSQSRNVLRMGNQGSGVAPQLKVAARHRSDALPKIAGLLWSIPISWRGVVEVGTHMTMRKIMSPQSNKRTCAGRWGQQWTYPPPDQTTTGSTLDANIRRMTKPPQCPQGGPFASLERARCALLFSGAKAALRSKLSVSNTHGQAKLPQP